MILNTDPATELAHMVRNLRLKGHFPTAAVLDPAEFKQLQKMAPDTLRRDPNPDQRGLYGYCTNLPNLLLFVSDDIAGIRFYERETGWPCTVERLLRSKPVATITDGLA